LTSVVRKGTKTPATVHVYVRPDRSFQSIAIPE
jgi:hypothetical protein